MQQYISKILRTAGATALATVVATTVSGQNARFENGFYRTNDGYCRVKPAESMPFLGLYKGTQAVDCTDKRHGTEREWINTMTVDGELVTFGYGAIPGKVIMVVPRERVADVKSAKEILGGLLDYVLQASPKAMEMAGKHRDIEAIVVKPENRIDIPQ